MRFIERLNMKESTVVCENFRDLSLRLRGMYGTGSAMILYVVHEGTAIGFAFVMGLKTRDIH